jgi:hypothetical protein
MPVSMRSMNIIARVADDIEKTGEARVMQAARHMRKAIVASAKATYPKVSGDLYKGVAAEGRGQRAGHKSAGRAYAIVGMTRPAYHAHLLEFGTKERVVKNFRGHPGRAVKVGRVKAKPFFTPPFEAEAGAVEQILSGTWVQ